MADQNFGIMGHVPMMTYNGGGLSESTYTLDSSGKSLVFVFQAPATDTITKVAVRMSSGSRTGTPPHYLAGIQGVDDTTGKNDGTYLNSGNAKVSFLPPATSAWDATTQEFTLAASASVSVGIKYALVITYDTLVNTGDTISSGACSTFVAGFNNYAGTSFMGLPYVWKRDSGSTDARSQLVAPFALRSATATYGQPLLSVDRTSYNSGSSPNEYGNKFRFLAGASGTFTCPGAVINGTFPIAGSSFIVTLYDSSSSALQTITMDSDDLGDNGTSGRVVNCYFSGTLSTLNLGSFYYLGVKAGGASDAMSMNGYKLFATGDMSALPSGANMIGANRAGGAWADDSQHRYMIYPMYGDVTISAGSGIVQPVTQFNPGLN